MLPFKVFRIEFLVEATADMVPPGYPPPPEGMMIPKAFDVVTPSLESAQQWVDAFLSAMTQRLEHDEIDLDEQKSLRCILGKGDFKDRIITIKRVPECDVFVDFQNMQLPAKCVIIPPDAGKHPKPKDVVISSSVYRLNREELQRLDDSSEHGSR